MGSPSDGRGSSLNGASRVTGDAAKVLLDETRSLLRNHGQQNVRGEFAGMVDLVLG
jgi:hypothetical protein